MQYELIAKCYLNRGWTSWQGLLIAGVCFVNLRHIFCLKDSFFALEFIWKA